MEFTKRDTNIVKGIAIFLMIFHHCFLDPGRYEGQIVDFSFLSEASVNKIALSFKICVALFVFLSGYGMTFSFKKKNPQFSFSAQDCIQLTLRRYLKLTFSFIFVFILVQIYSLVFAPGNRFIEIYGTNSLNIQFFRTPTFLATFWYISVALVLIVILPLLLSIYRKYGWFSLLWISILFSLLFPTSSKFSFCYLPDYLFTFSCGIICADKDLLIKLKRHTWTKNRVINLFIKFFGLSALIIIMMYYRQKTLSTELLPIWNGFISTLIIAGTFIFISPVPVISPVFELIGRYSMNIFLIHNFIRVVWYYDFTYSFRNIWLITLVLLILSFIISVMIDSLKKLIKYDQLIARMISSVIQQAASF